MVSNVRLQVVQALYQMDMTSQDVEELVTEFTENYWDNDLERLEAEEICFERILRGAIRHLDVIDARLSIMLSQGWRAERMDRTMRAILRAGLYELLFSTSVSAQVVIKEYRRLAESFFSSSQVGLVRGILAQTLEVIDRQ